MHRPAPRWLLAGCVLVALLLPSPVSVPLAALVLLVVAGSRWWVRRAARSIRARCRVPAWGNFDEHVEAVVEVRNASRLPAPWVELDVPAALGLGRAEPYQEALVLPPRSAVTRTVALRCRERGRHRVGPARVRTGDVLGIADAHAAAGAPADITVFPRIVPLEHLGLPAQSPFVTVPSRRSLLYDLTAVVGVRDYRPGDPLSAVHWPATARTRRLTVKQYERAEARDTLVCLDLCPQGYPRGGVRDAVELAITVSASVLHHALVEQRLSAGLLAASWSARATERLISLPPRTDHAHLRRMLEFLALAELGAAVPMAELLAGLGGLPAGTTVLAVTGKLGADEAAHLLRLAREGVPVAVALTGPHAGEDMLTAGDLWLPVYRVTGVPEVGRLAA